MNTHSAAQILTDPQGRRYIVGMHWKRIVTTGAQGAQRDALAYARECGATHVVFTHSQRGDVSAVGCAVLGKAETEVLSLANAYCLSRDDPGRGLLAIALDDQQVWLCAVADGMVLNGQDRVLPKDQLDAARTELLQRYADEPAREEGELLDATHPLSLTNLFERARAHQPECVLRPLRSYSRLARRSLVAAGAAGLALAYLGYSAWDGHRQRQQRALEELNRPPEVSAAGIWNTLLVQWERSADLASPAALDRLLDALDQVPLDLADWRASQIRCARQSGRWTCRVRYERRASRGATTQALLEQLPHGWSIDTGSIDTVTARFGHDAPAMEAKVRQLPALADAGARVLTQLQLSSRAFTSVDMGPATAVKMGRPVDQEGQPVTIDPAVAKPAVVSQSILVAGPLRSLYALHGLPISWNSVQLDIATTSANQADLVASALMVREARGEVYGQQ